MRRTEQRWINIERKVAFLSEPAAYPDRPRSVEVIETHKSWVFLTDDYAYKLKRPIRYNSVDFRPLDARCADCETEVALNRRLAGDVYIGVVPLTLGEDDSLAIDGPGPLVDCLVKMKRLPADRMLSYLIAHRRVETGDIQRVARKLARFYERSPSVLSDPAEYRAHLRGEIELSLEALSWQHLGLGAGQIDPLRDGLLGFLDRGADLLDERVRAGQIIDGHGDLRAEHVCVLPDPVIFDCLEFDSRLRRVDPVDELSFLGLECARLGDDSIEATLIREYEDLTGDSVPDQLIAFYTVYRAAMWARLAAWRTGELSPSRWGKWFARMESYLQIAEDALPALLQPSASQDQP